MSQVSVQGPAVRSVFERYDSGLYSAEKVVSTLQGLGLKTPQSFVDLLNQFARSRNLPYRDFLKALTTESQSDFKAEGLPVNSIRQLNLRSAPVAAAAKAPFDTITEFSDATSAQQARHKRYLPPTAHLESHEENQDLAKHKAENCKASEAVFGRTVDVFHEDVGQKAPTPRDVDERKLKLIAGHGDIITWQEDHFVDVPVSAHHPAIPVSDRKIAEVQGAKSLLVWSEDRAVPVAQLRSPRMNILAFDENCERNKFPTSSIDVKMSYPFATEADDLAAARARYHKQRIHKISASPNM